MAHVEPSTPQAAPPAAPPTQEKRGPGRPPKDSAPPPATGAPRFPAPAAQTLSLDQLLTYWRGVPEEFRARLVGYLYRYWPIIRQEPKYIDVFNTPPESEQDLLRLWGTGTYELKLTDNDKQLGRGEVCKARFTFKESYVDCPPVIQNLPVVLDRGRKENASYIAWLESTGKLNMAPQQNQANDAAVQALASGFRELLAEMRGQAKQGGGVEATVSKIGELYASANKAMLDMALSQVKGQSPADFIELLVTLQKLQQPAQTGPDPRLTMLTDELKAMRADLSAEREANRKLMEKLLDARTAPPPKSEESELTKGVMGRLIERALDSLDGSAGRSARRSMLAEVLDTAGPQIDKALDVAKVFGQALGALWSQPRQPVQQPHPPAAPTMPAQIAPAPPPPPHGVPTAPNPAPPQQAPQPPQQQQADPEEQAMRQMLIAFLDRNWPTIQKFINEGTPGQAFADYLMDGGALSAPLLRMIVEIGPEKIMDVIKATPDAWAAVQPIEPVFSEFLGEFLAWKPGWDEEGEEPPPGPQLVPPPKGAA